MFSRIAARGVALLSLAFPLIGSFPGAVFAQYQLNFAAIAADIAPDATVPEPFGLNVLPVSAGELVSKWNVVVADIRAESDTLARCRDDAEPCPAAAQNSLR